MGSSIAALALWLMVGELMVLLLMVSVQMALGSSIAEAVLWLMVGELIDGVTVDCESAA